jgi:hypothetical protein
VGTSRRAIGVREAGNGNENHTARERFLHRGILWSAAIRQLPDRFRKVNAASEKTPPRRTVLA